MTTKTQSRPYAHHGVRELGQIVKALSMLSLLNTPEEEQRLKDVKAELELRKRERQRA